MPLFQDHYLSIQNHSASQIKISRWLPRAFPATPASPQRCLDLQYLKIYSDPSQPRRYGRKTDGGEARCLPFPHCRYQNWLASAHPRFHNRAAAQNNAKYQNTNKFQMTISKSQIRSKTHRLEFRILVIVICLLFAIWNFSPTKVSSSIRVVARGHRRH